MSLHQCRETQFIADLPVFAQLLLRKQGTDQQHRIRTECLRFPDHILIHGKILTNAGDTDLRRDIPQICIAPEEPFRLREYGNAGSSGFLIGSGNLQIRKVRCDQAFGWGSFFAFADEADIRTAKRLFEGEGFPYRTSCCFLCCPRYFFFLCMGSSFLLLLYRIHCPGSHLLRGN